MADLLDTQPVSSGPFCSTRWTVILTDDFAIVFSTFSGNTEYIDDPETGKQFTLTANEDTCGDTEKTTLSFCWFKIQFVEIGSYDAENLGSWVYKSVPSVQLRFTHGGTGTDLTIQAFQEPGQKAGEIYDEGTFVVGDPIEPCTDVAPNTYSFSDFDNGIKEIVIKTDHDDSVLLDLFLYSDYQLFTHATGQCYEDPYAEISADPPIADFLTVDVGFPSDTITVAIKNDGNIDLTITDIGDPSIPVFEVTEKPAVPITIVPGSSEDLVIVFTPSSDTQFDGTIRITSDAENDPFDLSLTGIGIATPTSGLVLLIDTSGSMKSDYAGLTYPAPEGRRRLDLVKRAVEPFLVLLRDLSTELQNPSFGIATFPTQPWDGTCIGETLVDCVRVIPAPGEPDQIQDAIDVTLGGLTAYGATPLLAGIDNALNICQNVLPRAMVILSDGYHNCPGDDEDVTGRIDQLNANSVKVYTIGFARDEEFDSPLLSTLASETEGVFYPVTGGFFGLETWEVDDPPDPSHPVTPITALQTVYKNILADYLGIGSIEDPFRVIKGGDLPIDHEVNLCEYDKKVSFYLGWASAQKERLTLEVKSSDGEPVPINGNGIRLSSGTGYTILTVGNEFLKKNDKVGLKPWHFIIKASGLEKGESENLQYSVLVNSDLKLETKIISPELITGAGLTLQALVMAHGKPITKLKDTSVLVKAPKQSLGNWYAKNIVSEEDLKSVDLKCKDESLSAIQRKAIYLTKTLKDTPPGVTETDVILPPIEKHRVDTKVIEGTHSSSFSRTKKEGSYSFHFKVSGTTAKGNKFKREVEVKRYLRAIFSPEHSDIKLKQVSITKGLQKIRVDLTPKDKYGNHLGPGKSSTIQLTPSGCKLVGTMNDNLSGSYSQIIEVPVSDVSDARLKVSILNTSTDVRIKPSTGLRSLFNRFRWLLLVIIGILIIYIVYLGMQP